MSESWIQLFSKLLDENYDFSKFYLAFLKIHALEMGKIGMALIVTSFEMVSSYIWDGYI